MHVTPSRCGAIFLQKAAKKSPLRISPQQRKQQNIVSELGQVVPKVLITRAFPDDFKVRTKVLQR